MTAQLPPLLKHIAKFLNYSITNYLIAFMPKKTLKDINLSGKTVLHHCDFNIQLRKNENGQLVPISDIRLKAFFPSIFYLLEKNCKIVFLSWLGRPGGKVVESLRLESIAKRLSQLINKQVHALPSCIGKKVKTHIQKMKPGQMVMLENTRFYPGEEADDDGFAKKLAGNADLMVQDAFGHCHRIHASTTGIPRHIPAVAGFYLKEEMEIFDRLMKSPPRPFVLVIGGIKAADKVTAIKNLGARADYILVGGGISHNFLKAKGIAVGGSVKGNSFLDKTEKQVIALSKEILEKYGKKIILPKDFLASDSFKKPKKTTLIDFAQKESVRRDWAFVDIGPKTQRKFSQIIKKAKSVIWNGPVGKYEDKRFEKGTKTLAEKIAQNPGLTVVAGGDTAAAVEKFDLVFKYTHVSIAGGAALKYLSGETLPGIEALENK